MLCFSILCLISAFILCIALELNLSEACINDSEEKQRVLEGIVFSQLHIQDILISLCCEI